MNDGDCYNLFKKLDWNALKTISNYYTVFFMQNEYIKEFGIKDLYLAITVNKMVDLFKDNPDIIVAIYKWKALAHSIAVGLLLS